MPNVYISLGVHGFFRDAPTTLYDMILNYDIPNFVRFTMIHYSPRDSSLLTNRRGQKV